MASAPEKSVDYFDFLLSEVTEDNRSYYALRARQCIDVARRFSGAAPKTALDIGSGAGGLVNALRAAGVDAVGLEKSSGAVEHAKKTYGDHYVCRSLDALSDEDRARLGNRDLVTSFEVMQMFPYFELPRTLESLGDLVRPGGTLLIMVPNFGHPLLFPYLAHSDPFTKSFLTSESLYRAGQNLRNLKIEKIVRWNSASRPVIVSVRETMQKVAEKLVSFGGRFLFQMPGRINPTVHTTDILLSSHMAAVFTRK